MKKFIIVFIFIFLFLGQSILFAGDYEEIIKVSGQDLLPKIFFEHDFFDTKTNEGSIAYCLEPNKNGTEISDYNVIIKENTDLPIDKNILIKIIENGYPNKIFEGFNEKESQVITAMAFRGLAMEYLGLSKGRSAEKYVLDQYGDDKAKKYCYDLITFAKSSEDIFMDTPSFNLKTKDNNSFVYEFENQYYIGKEYTVEGDSRFDYININVKGDIPNNINYPATVKRGESFLVYFPVSEIEKEGEFTITATSKHTSNSIVYLKSTDGNKQSYLSYSNPSIWKSSENIFNYKPPFSSLTIRKIDEESGYPLPDVSFDVWFDNGFDQKKNYITNEKGEIKIDNILKLGEYNIMETKAKAGYEKNINIESIVVDNYNSSYEKIIGNKVIKNPELFIQKKGKNFVKEGEEVEYTIFDIKNSGNIPINNLIIEDILPYKYFNFNKSISISKFIESEIYEVFVTNSNGETKNLVNKNIDEDDELENIWGKFEGINIGSLTNKNNSVFFADEEYIINTNLNNIKELDFLFIGSSNVNEFIVPDFGTGIYDLFGYNSNGKFLIAENLNGNEEYKFKYDDKSISSYKVIFKNSINIDNLKLPEIKESINSLIKYDLIADTTKRNNIILSENLSSDIYNIIDINILYENNILSKEEKIKNLKISFKDLINPGFKIADKIILKGKIENEHEEKKESFFLNIIKIHGNSSINKEVKNYDEWDSKIIYENSLPDTGGYIFIFVTMLFIGSGILIISKSKI